MTTEQRIQNLTRQHLPKIHAAILAEDADAVCVARRGFLRAIEDVIDKIQVERPSCPLPLSEWPKWANWAAMNMIGYWGFYEAKPELIAGGVWYAQPNTASQQTDAWSATNDECSLSLYSRAEIQTIEAAAELLRQS